METSSFTDRFNQNAANFSGDRNSFSAQLAMKQRDAINRTFNLVKNEEKEYRDFLYEYNKAKFISDNAYGIYRGYEDPREEANATNLANIITKLYPSIPFDVARKNYRGIIKGITGDDMSATNVLSVAASKVGEGLSSSWLGVKNYMHLVKDNFFDDNAPEEVKKSREAEYSKELETALNSYKRTDYYNKDFDSFIEKAVLSAADFIPSEIFSLTPTLAGDALSAITGIPVFSIIGRGVSGSMAGMMEAGSASLELHKAGADKKTQLAFSSVVGVANGFFEYLGNVPERKISQKLFALNKSVGGIEGHVMKGLVRDVMKEWAFDYGMGLVMEPATEAVQELTQMYVMNLASKWQEKNKGKSFSDEFTYTPQEMADAMKETAVSTFRGQVLLGLTGVGANAISSMRKGGTRHGNEIPKGDLRKILDSRKYSTPSDTSVLVDNKIVQTDAKTQMFKPSDVDANGVSKDKLSPVKAYSIGGQYIPINQEEMSKAKFLKGNSEYGMYIDVVHGDEAKADTASVTDIASVTDTESAAYAASAEQVKRIINTLPDEVGEQVVEYGYTDNGDVIIRSKANLDAVAAWFVSENTGKVSNVVETDSGYTVTVDGVDVNFTTNADGAIEFSQADYVRSAKESSTNQQNVKVEGAWEDRVGDIKRRAEDVKSTSANVKARLFRTELNKVVNSLIEDPEVRKSEISKVNGYVSSISSQVSKAYSKALSDSTNAEFISSFKGRDIDSVSKSFARGTVMATAKLAQSMKMNVSDFLDKVNFKFSDVSMKEGRERAGWTEIHSDGTFDVNVTSLLDQTTGIHEMGHVYLSMLGDNYRAIEGFEKAFSDELGKDGGKVGRNTHEAFAEALESYVNGASAKSEGLRKVFNLVLDALRNFVNSVRDILSPDKVAMFDNLFEKGLTDYVQDEQSYRDETFFAKDAEQNDYSLSESADWKAENKSLSNGLSVQKNNSNSLNENYIPTSYTDISNQAQSTSEGNWQFDPSNPSLYYKNADLDMTSEQVDSILTEGRFVPNEVLDKYESNPTVKIERLAQNIVATKPEWFKLFKRAVDEYLIDTGKSFEDLNNSDFTKIGESWNKRLKGASNYMEIPQSDNLNMLIKRLNAYAGMESPERAATAWMDKLSHTRNGRENLRDLAKKMNSMGLFGDKLEGYDLSARFPALNMIADKVAGSESRGTRPRIDVSVYDAALDEAFRNRDYIRGVMNDESTNAYESNMDSADTTTNYVESEDIMEILKEKNVSSDVKEIVKNGMWNGTVVRSLMLDATAKLDALKASEKSLDMTERELSIYKERVKLYEQEISVLEKGISTRNNARIQELNERNVKAQKAIFELEKQINALADLLALEKLQAALYKTKRQIQDNVKGKSGEADSNRALRDAVNAIFKYNERERLKNPNLSIRINLEEMKAHFDENGELTDAKAPALAQFLEDNGFINADGMLVKGFEDMDVPALKAFRKAVKTDKENSRDRQKARQREFEARTQSIASKIISGMKPKSIEKNLSKDDLNEMRDEVARRSEGMNLDNKQMKELETTVKREIIAKKIQAIADGARYGIDSHSEAVSKKKNVIDDFTTLSRLLDAISPELREFVMDGLNQATDGKYRNVESRMKGFYSNIKQMYGFKSDKEMQKFLNSLVNERVDIGKVTKDDIPQRLKDNKLFMEMWESDEESGRNNAESKFKYAIHNLMAIEEQSLEWDGLRHLNKGNNISASEIAWTVKEFESENGSLAKYRQVADEIRRVYGERFQQIYETVLSVENREMTKVSFYSPMFGVGLDKDLMMRFSDVFGDDRKAQASWFTKDREFGTNAIDLNYYSRLERVVEMQEAYINGAEFYRQISHLFSEDGGNLRNIITEMYGAPQFKRIETIIDLTKTDAVRNVISEADNLVSKIRNHYVMARLAYNFATVVQQGASWFLGFTKYGPIQMFKSTIQFMKNPIQMCNRVYELSPQMKHAVNPLLKMAKETMRKNPTTTLGKVDSFVASIGDIGLTPMEKLDHIVRNILWWTSYQQEIADARNAKGSDLTFSEMDKAQRNATQWVLDIQSSSQVKDNSLKYSGGDLFWKQVLIFTNQLNKEWNILWHDGIKEGLFKGDFKKFFSNFAALGLATMFIVGVTGKIKNDEDDDETWIEDLMKDWGFEFISRVPIVGNTIKNVYEGFSYRQSDDIVTRLTQAINTLTNVGASDKQKKTAVKNVGWSALDLFGAPTTAIKRISQSFEGGEIMQADHFMRLLGGEWYKYFEE